MCVRLHNIIEMPNATNAKFDKHVSWDSSNMMPFKNFQKDGMARVT